MRNLKKKFSALALSALFATMQVSAMDTGLGVGNGGAVINNTQGGFVNMTNGNGYANLNFNGDTHVNWDSLNVNKGESLNFNAINGVSGITVLNTVNNGMSTIYGQINANNGIGKLIISNPNGMLYDGAKFTATGDVMMTTNPMSANFVNGKMDITSTTNNVGVITIKNSDFSIGGGFNILAPQIGVVSSAINTGKGMTLVTENGQDYISGSDLEERVRLEAVNIDGDVYIIAGKGVVKTVSGGKFNGNLKIESDGSVALNYVDNGEVLEVTGDVDVNGNGVLMYARNTKVDGNLNMENGGGFLEVGNVQVGKDMNLTTVAKSENNYGYKHFVHVIGNNKINGDVNIESKDNIHIGNYNYEEQKMLDGSLVIGGNLNAHAVDGHVAVTVDTSADKVNLKSDNLNVLTDGKAVISANEYQFSSNGYIGGINNTTKFINSMENYTFYPAETTSYVNIQGGKVTKIETGVDGEAYIASNKDMTITGANAGKVYLTSYGNNITISGDDVHADVIKVGGETDKLKVEFPSRDYTLKYTNIRDNEEVTINSTDEITYELTNGENGYNRNEIREANTTYLIGPDKVIEPVNPVDPDPDPVNPVQPTPEPDNSVPSISDNDNAKILNNMDRDLLSQGIEAPTIDAPVAYAADLDDDEDTGVRKNVDGSVTVVRAYPMGK